MKTLKKLFVLVVVALLGLSLASCGENSGGKKVGILVTATHSALDDAKEGFIEALKANGYADAEFVVKNPEGDTPTMNSMATDLVRNSDIVLGIGTPAAVALQNARDAEQIDITVLFTAVTDPVSAGLMTDVNKPTNITGTNDMNPVADQVDLIIELVDARTPLSSRNPDIDELGKNKSRMILLNKSDLSDPQANKAWMEYFESKGIQTVEVNAKSGNGLKNIQNAVAKACAAKIERDRKRGILNRPVRAMVVGIPNVGKSTFINSYAKKACTKTGNKPGVTKGKQWIKLNKTLELLDTPGILWPKFEDNEIGMRLAFIGSINDQILYSEELAADFIKYMQAIYPNCISEFYGFEKQDDPYKCLEEIARVRRCLGKNETLDIKKAAMILMDDFRSGKLGRLTLELPQSE